MQGKVDSQLVSTALDGSAEAAVLFAAGHVEGARAIIEALREQSSGLHPWRLLFDLHRALGEMSAFESLAVQFRARHPEAPQPEWKSSPVAGDSVLRLCGALESPAQLEDLMSRARRQRIVAIDFADVPKISLELAAMLCSSLRVLVRQSRRVILANVSYLHIDLLSTCGLLPEVTVLPRRTGAPAGVEAANAASMALAA